MNARELLTVICQVVGKDLNHDEGFRFGDPATEVRGVMVCWMADPDAIAAAAAAGANVIICHEALYLPYDIVDGLFWGSRAPDFLSWPANHQRVRLLAQHGLTVIRIHGSADKRTIFHANARQLGLEKIVGQEGDFGIVFEIAPRSVGELIADVKRRMDLPAVRVAVRDLTRIVRRVGMPWGGLGLLPNVGYMNHLLKWDPQVMIAGETDNYAMRFVSELGIDMIETSHEISENEGLREFAALLAAAAPEVPVTFHANPLAWRMM